MPVYKAKSIIISRKKDKKNDCYNALIALFNINDPHKSGKAASEVLEFNDTKNVKIYNCSLKFLLGGSDIVVNDLESVDIQEKNRRVYVKCRQKENPSL